MESLLAALGVVFLAELGDKTQLVALGFGARYRLAPVLTGVVVAYMATNLLSVIVGGLLGAALPTRAIGLVGGVLFIAFGIWTLRSDDDEDEADGSPGAWAWLAAVKRREPGLFVHWQGAPPPQGRHVRAV